MAVLVGTVAGAWACVPQPLLAVQPQSFGPAGSQVTVTGLNFGNVPVELRWNAFDGPRLQSVTGPEFTTSVTIPPVPDGLYVLLGIARSPDGSVYGSVPTMAFQVVTNPEEAKEAGATGAEPPGVRRPIDSTGSTGSNPGVGVPVAAAGGVALLVVGVAVGMGTARRRRDDEGAPVNRPVA